MYTTQVIRDRNSIKIAWANEAGDLWSVTKRFTLGSRRLFNATINCSARRGWDETERKQAHELAYDLDAALQRPEDFDRVKISDNPAMGGRPAHLDGIVSGGPIYIAIAAKDEAEKKRAEYTSGPWVLRDDRLAPQVWVETENGHTRIVRFGPRENWDNIDYGNARLVAAAPEMLELLKLAQYAIEAAWLAGVTRSDDQCTTIRGADRDKFLEARTELRDLLAKVRGEGGERKV